MKSDRMFGILCILLERENVTVRELAGYFEVSTRTIHRDLLDLSASGFPVVTRQGVGGGVSLLPNFRYNKSALSEDDMKVILAGIEGLATIDDSARMKTLLAKLRFSDGNRLLLENDIILDFSLSPAHFRRIFSSVMETSPLKYLTDTRIRQAASLLRTTEASVLSISEEVGYHSVSSFNRQFHDTMGQTPREWRRRMSILKDQSVMKYRGFLVPETLVQHCINS